MNLSDYINLTLNEITEGVRKANASNEIMGDGRVLTEIQNDAIGIPIILEKERGEYIKKPIIKVAFRVGVEIDESEESNNKIKGSLKVISAGLESSSKDEKRSLHEVSFELPLILSKK